MAWKLGFRGRLIGARKTLETGTFQGNHALHSSNAGSLQEEQVVKATITDIVLRPIIG